MMVPPKKLDACGLKVHKKIIRKDEKNNDVVYELNDIDIVFPSLRYKNIYALLDDPDLKPAFFKDYKILIDKHTTGDQNI